MINICGEKKSISIEKEMEVCFNNLVNIMLTSVPNNIDVYVVDNDKIYIIHKNQNYTKMGLMLAKSWK